MAAEEDQLAHEITSRPISDPSSLTTLALHREVANLKEMFALQLSAEIKNIEAKIAAIDRATVVFHDDLVRVPTDVQKAVGNLRELHEARFTGLKDDLQLAREVIETRFDGMDRALKLLQDIADRFPERIDEKIHSLKEINEGQFTAIQGQFVERDVRLQQGTEASAIAIGAALQAAKEAVAEQNRSSALAIAKSEAATDKRIDQIGALVATATGALDGKITDIKDRLIIMEGRMLGVSGEKQESHTSSSFIVSLIATAVAVLALLSRFWGGR